MEGLIAIVERITGNRVMASRVIETLLDEGLLKLPKGEPGVEAITRAFKKHFGTTRTSSYDRYAAKRLADSHGTERVVGVIKALAWKTGEQYCPVVNSVSDLEKKWVSVGRYLSTVSGDRELEI